jgi:coiled-coil domain-containing protein 55
MKLSFSLNKPKQAAAAPSLKRPTAFGSTEDEDPIDAAPTSSANQDRNNAAANKKLLAQNVGSTSKAAKKRFEAEQKVDSTVYEYDEVWDKMQEVKQRQKEAKEVDSKDRKVSEPPNASCNIYLICLI